MLTFLLIVTYRILQVSSEEPKVKFSTESKSFWDETTRLLQDLSSLRSDVDEIACPCNKPNCPFKHDVRNGSHKSRLQEQSTPSLRNEHLSNTVRHNVANYLASMRPTRSANSMDRLFRQDCKVTEEPLATSEQNNFVRNSPLRKAQRRHSAIRVSSSYPVTMNLLMVPSNSCPVTGRCNSLPTGFTLYKGSSLDSLDSDKMHDIQISYLRGQQHALSNNDLMVK